MAFVANTPAAGFHPVARMNAAFEGFKAARKRRALFDETVRELNNLSTRELIDLGIDRADIKRLAHDHVYNV